MIDSTLIHIRSGDGGNGVVSFRREKFAPNGGPDGGDGGNGGDIFLIADRTLNTLKKFQYRQKFEAVAGGDGSSKKRHGATSDDLVITLPVGTEVWEVSSDPNKPEELIADLSNDGDTVVAAKGGRGGQGNVKYVTSQNQEPMLAEGGQRGVGRELRLELKLLADVGIIGMPNAGKSSLLTALTGAHPKVAEYPFTTLEPSLGVLSRRLESIVLVEIPGLIEGAAEGIGLGHDFLRHVERTRMLVHLVDGTADDIEDRMKLINAELLAFDEKLAETPQIAVINKSDLPAVSENFETLEVDLAKNVSTGEVFCVSAATYAGLENLSDALFRGLARIRADQEAMEAMRGDQSQIRVLRPSARTSRPLAELQGSGFRILHERAIRVANASDLNVYEVQIQLHSLLGRLGVVKALEELGVKSGDTVFIGEAELEWN
ncbi:MAG: GTPase ObgE [Dehalococcoidia bacterium]